MPDMIYAAHRGIVIWNLLEVTWSFSQLGPEEGGDPTLPIIMIFVYPARSHYPYPIHHHTPSCSQVVDVRRKPATMIQLPHIIARLVIPSNDDGQDWRLPFAGVVLLKRAQVMILRWDCERRKVVL